jgi:hypothetical protein
MVSVRGRARHSLIAAALALFILLGFAPAAQAQTLLPIADGGVSYTFGQQIIVRGQITPGASVESVTVFMQSPADPFTITAAMAVREDLAVYIHDPEARFVQPFAQIAYWFEVTLENGEVFTSSRFSFYYEDNRFDWQDLQDSGITVKSYAHDAAAARAVLDLAVLTGEEASQRLESSVPRRLQIYIYGGAEDFQLVQEQLGPLWISGHADPANNVIMAWLPLGDETGAAAGRKIPHEVGHQVLYNAAEAIQPGGYRNLPAWLIEGFASGLELNPNADYAALLRQAASDETLIPLETLCTPFPTQGTQALLSYAQASDFTRFLDRQYGDAGMRALIAAYARGGGCVQASTAPFGLSLLELENEWQGTGLTLAGLIPDLDTLMPWLVMLGAIMIAPLILLLSALRTRPDSENNEF